MKLDKDISVETIEFMEFHDVLRDWPRKTEFSVEKFKELWDRDHFTDQLESDGKIPFEELKCLDGFIVSDIEKRGGDRDFQPTFTLYKLKRGNERLKFESKSNYSIDRDTFEILSFKYKVK